MPRANPITGLGEQNTPGSISRPGDVPVAALLKDSIVGITCFPDPLPRRGKRGSRRWWRRTSGP
jgi:hypothetical protein